MVYDINARVHARANINVKSDVIGTVIDGQKIANGDILFLNDYQTNPNERNVWKVQVDGTLTPLLRAMDAMWLVVIEQGTSAANSYRWDSSPGQWVLQSGGTTVLTGTSWYDGPGAPSAYTGVDGDYYLDDTAGNVYKKTSGSWTLITNLKGATGTSGGAGAAGATGGVGANGSTWLDGYGAPGAIGNNGDFYLNLSTGDIYQKGSGSWTAQFNIKGANGVLLHVATQALRDALPSGIQYAGVEVVTEDYGLLWRRPSMASSTWNLVSPEPITVTAIAAEVTNVANTYTGTVDGQALVNGGGYLLPNVTNPGIYFYNTATQKFDTSLVTTSNSIYPSGFLAFANYGSNYSNTFWKYNGTAWSQLLTGGGSGTVGPGTPGWHSKFISDGYHIANSIVYDDGNQVSSHGSYLDYALSPSSYTGNLSKAPKVGRIASQYSQFCPTPSTFVISTAILGNAMPANRQLYGILKLTQRLDAAATSGWAGIYLITATTDGSGNITANIYINLIGSVGGGTAPTVAVSTNSAANFNLSITNGGYSGNLSGVLNLELCWAGA